MKFNLSKLLLYTAIGFALVIVCLCIDVFVNISIDVFTPIKYNIAKVCSVGALLSMCLFFIIKKY